MKQSRRQTISKLSESDQTLVLPGELVFESPVRSGLLTLRDMDRDRNRSTITIKGQKTGLLWSFAVLDRSSVLTGFNRSRPVFSAI